MKPLNEVGIFNEDAKTFIRRLDCPHALFYCDPPYPEANQGHYCGYSLDDWMELCELLDSIEGSYILSGYEQPIVPKSAQKIIEIPTICSAPNSATMSDGKLQPRLEKLWICDRSSNISEPLKSVAIQHCEKMNPRFGTQQLNILEVVNGHQTH